MKLGLSRAQIYRYSSIYKIHHLIKLKLLVIQYLGYTVNRLSSDHGIDFNAFLEKIMSPVETVFDLFAHSTYYNELLSVLESHNISIEGQPIQRTVLDRIALQNTTKGQALAFWKKFHKYCHEIDLQDVG